MHFGVGITMTYFASAGPLVRHRTYKKQCLVRKHTASDWKQRVVGDSRSKEHNIQTVDHQRADKEAPS
jgi:hypothetical protein